MNGLSPHLSFTDELRFPISLPLQIHHGLRHRSITREEAPEEELYEKAHG